jgi:hypothetical protein
MSLGWKFYIKFLIVLIPLSLMMLVTLFMPRDKAIEYVMSNKIINKLENWCWNEWN